MSNAITTFSNEVLNTSIRTTTDENNEPWFCLADVCKALELKSNDVKKRLKCRHQDKADARRSKADTAKSKANGKARQFVRCQFRTSAASSEWSGHLLTQI